MHDLRAEVADDEMVDRVAVDWTDAGLDEPTHALVVFAEKLTRSPSEVDTGDIEALRAAGHDDAAISSCVQVVSYFNYINRIAEGLGVELEDWIEANGRRKPG